MDQPTFEEIQRQYIELLGKSVNMRTEDILPEVRTFLETLAQAGLYIEDRDSRALLREQIHYWASFVNDKTGSYPAVRLLPFDVSQANNRAEKATEQTIQQPTGVTTEPVEQATQQVTEVAQQATQQAVQQVTEQVQQTAQQAVQQVTEQVQQTAQQVTKEATEQVKQTAQLLLCTAFLCISGGYLY